MFRKNKIRKMTLNRALDKYLKTVSVHKKGHLQEFYRVNVIKRHPMAERYMDEITTVDIATYRDQRLAQINPRTGRQITGNTVRLELALLSSLFNIARVEWGTCRMNPVELVRKPKISNGRDRAWLLAKNADSPAISEIKISSSTLSSIWPWKQQ